MSPISEKDARRFAPGRFLCEVGPSPVWVVGEGVCAPFDGLAGILNVTPDSFSDGGLYASVDAAVTHGLALLDEGAVMLDVGAESTRPRAAFVDAQEERRRLVPVLEGVLAARPGALLSVDTYKASTARVALEAGARVINDVSAWGVDPALPEVLATFKPGYVLMHNLGIPATLTEAPRYDSVVDEVCAFFECKLAALVRAGLPEDRVVLDPGIGFGKTAEQSFELLRGLDRLARLGRPLYVGLSMKSLFGGALGLPLEARGEATRLATVLLAGRGVRYHRVHHVAETRRALELAALLTPTSSTSV